MKRLLVVGGFLSLGILLTVLSFVGRRHGTSHENMVRIREQTPTQPPEVNFNRGRLGSEVAMSVAAQTWTGMLVDAGCAYRDAMPQMGVSGRMAVQTGGSTQTPQGSTAVESQRADAMAQLTPDVRARNSDPACAVTALTRAYAISLPNGEWKNLDEGGNTKASVAFESSAQGQAVMNGRSLGDKPRVSVKGVQHGDRIVVQDIRVL